MRKIIASPLFLLLPILCSCSVPFIARLPLQTVYSRVGSLSPEKGTGVTVVVHDNRPQDVVLGGLTSTMQPSRIHWLFATRKSGEVADLFRSAARQATGTLGFTEGTNVTLEITIKDFRIDMHQSGSIVNCIGYGLIESVLKSTDGATLRSRSSKVAYWEDTTGFNGYGDISRAAISRIYSQAAWEATAGILQEQFPSGPDPAALGRTIGVAEKSVQDTERREAIFWLGLTAKGDPSIGERLLTLFRTSKHQETAEAAAEAIGMLGVDAAREDFEAVLSGAKKLPEWDMEDTEEVWYLLKALHGLGTTDLERRIPNPKALKMHGRLTDLTHFLLTGTIPPLSPSREQDFENGRLKLK